MQSRSLSPNAIGSSDDAPIPPRVRLLRVFEPLIGHLRSLTGHKIRPGDAWQIDHVLALVNGGENRHNARESGSCLC